MKTTIIATTIAMLMNIIPVNTPGVSAVTPEDRRAIQHNTMFYEDRDFSKCIGETLSSSVLPDESTVPDVYKDIFSKAAQEYGIDVGILATVFYVENRGFPSPDKDWPVSSGGAKGPFQFLDDTWNGFGVDANDDGTKDVDNLEDASYGAAKYLESLGANVGLETGGLDQDFSQDTANKETVAWVLKSYNAGPNTFRDGPNDNWYRPEGGDWGSDKQAEIDGYIQLGLEQYRQIATAEAGTNANECGGLGRTDDIVFPLQTTQEEIRQGVESATWCYNSTTNCHGQYNAADIHVPIGTPVVAAAGGTIIQVRNTDRSLSVRVRGDDGLFYFYQHMTIDSERVAENESIEEGDTLGEVGDRTAAFGTPPHLHFDVAPERVGISRECVREGRCTEEKSLMIDTQPQLIEAFKELPEG